MSSSQREHTLAETEGGGGGGCAKMNKGEQRGGGVKTWGF